jgi:hypothetical protein
MIDTARHEQQKVDSPAISMAPPHAQGAHKHEKVSEGQSMQKHCIIPPPNWAMRSGRSCCSMPFCDTGIPAASWSVRARQGEASRA